MLKKVEKCTFVQEWSYQGVNNYNFVVKFEGSDDRFVYVGKDKDNPKFKEGQEAEYNVTDKKIKVFVGDKTFEYPKIEAVKQQNGFGGGFGGGKSYVKTPDQVRNDLIGFVGGYAKDVIAHRTNIGKDVDDIIIAYDKLVDGMFKSLSKHVK